MPSCDYAINLLDIFDKVKSKEITLDDYYNALNEDEF